MESINALLIKQGLSQWVLAGAVPLTCCDVYPAVGEEGDAFFNEHRAA